MLYFKGKQEDKNFYTENTSIDIITQKEHPRSTQNYIFKFTMVASSDRLLFQTCVSNRRINRECHPLLSLVPASSRCLVPILHWHQLGRVRTYLELEGYLSVA